MSEPSIAVSLEELRRLCPFVDTHSSLHDLCAAIAASDAAQPVSVMDVAGWTGCGVLMVVVVVAVVLWMVAVAEIKRTPR